MSGAPVVEAGEPASGTLVGQAWPSEERPGAWDFDPMPVVFDWSDRTWIEQNLVMARLAVGIVKKSRADLVRHVSAASATEDGTALLTSMLNDFEAVSGHLTALAAIVDSARARVFLTVDWLDPLEAG